MENYKLLIIKTDGHAKYIDSPKIPKLETLQELVDGYIEATPCWKDYIFLVNDEGAINSLRYNFLVSLLQTAGTGNPLDSVCQAAGTCGPMSPIFGDVVVAIGDNDEIRAMTEDEYEDFVDWSLDVCALYYNMKKKRLYENKEATGAFKDINAEEWPPVEADEGADI